MTTVDLFADVATADQVDNDQPVTVTTDEPVASGGPEATEAEPAQDKPEILSEVPDGAMTVSAFAEMLSKTVQVSPDREVTFVYGIVPGQTVYQATRAKNNPLPSALVQEADWPKPVLYILDAKGTGEAYWKEYTERNANRGSGTSSVAGSKRSAEDLLTGYHGAVKEHAYNLARLALWQGNVESSQGLLDKYTKWLDGAGVTTETIEQAHAAAIKAHADEQAAKKANAAARRAAKAAEKSEANA